MPMNPIATLIRNLRRYLHDLQQSRQDLADSTSSDNLLPPLPPGDDKHKK
jgi:hypothetical protein